MSCQIVIDTPGPFYAGTQIQGKLICTFNGRQKIRGIKIRAYGDEHTEWWGTESYYNHTEKRHETRSVLYTGDNNLFSLESMLYGGHSGDLHVGPGRFTYPFSFQLPLNLPSTFENSYGHIRYTLKGIVDIPWGMDHEDKIHFVLLSLIDLNNFPLESFQPVSLSDEKTICCWCCAGGDITVNININKTAFVPGENIKLYVALTNMSNSNVDGLEAKLIQHIRSQVHSPNHESKRDENTLAYDNWSGVGAHGENKYDIEIPIPVDIAVPNLDRSSLFEVNYDIQISANIPGCHSDIDLSFSVNIGHIQNQSQLNGPPSSFPPQQEAGGYPPYTNGGSSAANSYPYSPGAEPNAPYPGVVPYPGGPFPSGPGAPYPPGSGGIYPPGPPAATGGYPSGPPGSTAAYPPGPPGGTGAYPPGPPGGTGVYPPGNVGYPSGPPNYASVSAAGPSEKPIYPGGFPSAPGEASAGNIKEREAMSDKGGAPSAPREELPPPSYADISKKNY